MAWRPLGWAAAAALWIAAFRTGRELWARLGSPAQLRAPLTSFGVLNKRNPEIKASSAPFGACGEGGRGVLSTVNLHTSRAPQERQL